MASRFWVGGSGTWDSATTTHWSATTGGVGGASVPTTTDDVFLDASSTGTITISSGTTQSCQNLDCTGFTGTLVVSGVSTFLDIYANLTLVAGMTLTHTSSGTIRFRGNVGGNITSAAKTFGLVIFGQAGDTGTWTFQDNFTETASGNITLASGTLNTNGKTVNSGAFNSSFSNTRTLTMGTSIFNLSSTATPWSCSTNTNMTITANTATINCTGAGASFTPGSAVAGTGTTTGDLKGASVNFTGSGVITINSGSGSGMTCANFTRTGTAVKTDSLVNGGPLTCTGTFTVTGNSVTNRMFFSTNTIGTTKTVTAAAVSLSNADFMDTVGAGAASPFTGTSLGDALGNSGITFDTPVTRYAVVAGNASSTATWSASSGGVGGVSVPLPQDTVIFDAGSAAGTYTADMPRMGAGIDFTGFSATFTLGTTITTYGSLTMVAGMTFTPLGQTYFLAGRGTHTINSGGKTIPGLSIKGPSSTYSLLADLFLSSGLTFFQGSFTTNNFNITATQISSNTVNFAKTFSFGSSTMTITGTGAAWNWFNANNTILPNTATIRFTDTSATTKTLQGNDANYNGMNIIIDGSATNAFALGNASGLGTGFNNVTISAPNHVTIFAAKTLGFNNLIATGSSGNVITIDSSTAGTAGNLVMSASSPTNLVSCDWLSLKDSAATPHNFYAGANSTSVSGNTGWIFTVPPVASPPTIALMGVGV